MTASITSLAVLAVGALSALFYARRRQWVELALVVLAALALAAMFADLRQPGSVAANVTLSTDAAGNASEAALLAVPQAGAILLRGDGLREAQWRDLPARPLQWKPAADADLLWLDFPRSVALGRLFQFSARRGQAQAGWRLQLLAENGQLLAEARAAAATDKLSLQWLPPLAEAMLLQARLLDAAGKTIAAGPLPLQVVAAAPLQVLGRFDAPSFDARALNQLLAEGDAVLDWQLTLGKAIARGETARVPLTQPNLLLVDAAYVEHLNPAARAALLAQVAQGAPLLVLGANAADAALWQREFGLRLRPQSATTEKEDMRQFSINGAALALAPAGLNPDAQAGAGWTAAARDDKQQAWLWQRDWQRGRVLWLGVADWHRYAISAPQPLALWWQQLLDRVALPAAQKSAWRLPDPMPLPGLRSELCGQGFKPGEEVRLDGMAAARWQARAEQADAVCVALWPRAPGWQKFASAGQEGMEYVYAAGDWPAWQRALRRDATARYAARSEAKPALAGANATASKDATVATNGVPLPAAPFALLFALCMLLLWWREQR
ncbi:hypothetical protein CSQ96_14180 [Janthinobacterium sp. BJB412]|nr:hypothetical protein CSQ96_14180 [Janthinobacterium sp. BJB412]